MPAAEGAGPPRGRAGGPGPRRRARVLCVQALYRAEVVGDDPRAIATEILGDEALAPEVRNYAWRLLDLVIEHRPEIDAALVAALARWDLGRLAVIDRAVLRLGAAELLHEPELAAGIILDESIEIAKSYGSNESGRFVNGVLDRVARDRAPEEETGA